MTTYVHFRDLPVIIAVAEQDPVAVADELGRAMATGRVGRATTPGGELVVNLSLVNVAATNRQPPPEGNKRVVVQIRTIEDFLRSY